jgi:two-component system, OmpR family, response regulator
MGRVEPFVAIVEDDAELRGLVRRGLAEEGFRVRTFATGAELLASISDVTPDALVVDIGLPDADGRDVCQALRTRGIDAPVLFLTARDALPDRLAGFRAGGDDYVTKPFAIAELAERLRALVRRARPSAPPAPQGAGPRLDPGTHSLRLDDARIVLTPTEYRLLATLMQHHGQVVRRRTLVGVGWPHGAIVHDNMLDAFIVRLRRKLARLPEGPSIETVRGVGYSIR